MEEPARRVTFAERPILVFWETTVACPLSCRHCRASAVHHPLPGQLDHAESLDLVDQVAELGQPRPVLVMPGGDCLARPDLKELVAHARTLGVPVALSPSVSPQLDRSTMAEMKSLGVKAVSVSLDGSTPTTHERVRGVDGHFQATVDAIRWLVEMGFRVQVNTTVMRSNLEELADVAALLLRLAVPIWEVFFLIEVGRGEDLRSPTAEENEEVCHFLYETSRHPLLVRTVEAPFFRRVVAERRSGADFSGPLYLRLRTRLQELAGPGGRPPRPQTVGTRDGMGVVFVSHDGLVRPSGFLPMAVGDLRRQRLAEVYRESPLLRSIRAAEFSGRCGSCAYRQLCGGSRARAFAAGGDPLGEDPGCAYRPAA